MRSSRFINDIKDNRVVTELLRHRRVYLFEYFPPPTPWWSMTKR